jgi:imidazolonepropionase-like amidohydrolase
MSPIDALVSATLETAKLLGESDTLGSISVGKIADIIAVSGDPIIDMNSMKDVIFVMKEGKVYVDKTNE